jgi:hypothetical protein
MENMNENKLTNLESLNSEIDTLSFKLTVVQIYYYTIWLKLSG